MMAVAGWLVWRRGGSRAGSPFGGSRSQLVLNVGWSAVFFGLRMPGLAFVEILVLWLAIAATLLTSWRVSRTAGILLAPYLLWVSFAAILNFAIWRLNA